MPKRILIAVLLSMFATGAAYAETARDLLTEIARCADVADTSERLKCFDAAAARTKTMLANETAPKKSFLDWFGFATPPKPVTKTEDFGKPPQAEPGELTQVTANVTELAKTARGKAIFILDNGQVWRQLDSDSTDVQFAAPGRPMKVTIDIGVMASYNLVIEGRNGLIKVTRLK